MRSLIRIKLLAFLLLGILLSNVSAETPIPVPVEVDTTQVDREQLLELKNLYEEALNNNELTKLEPHLADDFTGVVVTSRAVSSFSDLTKYYDYIWGLIGKGGSYKVKVNYEPGIIEGNIAIGRGTTEEYVKTGDGSVYEFPTEWTAVFRKTAGSWKLLRLHASMDPIENVFIVAWTKATKIMFGVGGLLLGLVLGVIAKSIFAKKTPSAA